MIKYLKEHYGNRQSGTLSLSLVHANERLELSFLKEQVAKRKATGGVIFSLISGVDSR